MSRLYAVESVPTNTGTLADHRLPLPPHEVEAFTLALAQAVGAVSGGGEVLADARAKRWLPVIAADLMANPGASLVVADEHASPEMQVLVHAINQALGNTGRTVFHTAPVEVFPANGPVHGSDQVESMRQLVADMAAGRVDLLLMLDGVNPVYTAPADLGFTEALQKVGLRVHHGLYEDETAEYCQWHLPAAHELESWGDARSWDGTVSLIQPLIEPLYNGRTAIEILAVLFANRADATSYDVVREHWKTLLAGDFESAWRKALHDGLVPDTQISPIAVSVNGGAAQAAASTIVRNVQQARGFQGKVTLRLRPDPTVWDGSLAPNPWLQELPKPMTKLTWDNALTVGPATAERLKLVHEEMAEITWNGRKVQAAVWVLPGVAEGTAELSLGYGRRRAGRATGLGFDAYPLRTSQALWNLPGAEIRTLGERYAFACTQNHHVLPQGRRVSGADEIPLAGDEAERRELIRTATLEELRRDPMLIQKEREQPKPDESLFPAYKYEGHAWGMAIDLNACIGCNACVIACQAENNIPVVGKEQVQRGREMHWLRIDRYYEGDLDNPRSPPPAGALHALRKRALRTGLPGGGHRPQRRRPERHGLQPLRRHPLLLEQLPLQSAALQFPALHRLGHAECSKLLRNPDVTVRTRGVMEKCTYCVQRINAGQDRSESRRPPIATAKSSPPASRPARPRPSSSATSTTRAAESPS